MPSDIELWADAGIGVLTRSVLRIEVNRFTIVKACFRNTEVQ